MENISIEDVTLDCNSNYEWKQVKGFEGIYDLRSDGLLYSHPRKNTKGGYTYGQPISLGYLKLTLTKERISTQILGHIIVYETFVGTIPKGYVVHHKNHIRTDNRLENLELMPRNKHSKMHNEEKSKSVLQFTKDGQFVAEYESAYEAERQTGISQCHICDCCNNKPHHKTAGGYIWKFKNISEL